MNVKTPIKKSLVNNFKGFFKNLFKNFTNNFNNLKTQSYLQKYVFNTNGEIIFFRQSRVLIIIKVVLVSMLLVIVFPYYKTLGNWFETIVSFFKLHEIFKFTFPKKSFFQMIAMVLFLGVISYHSFLFLYSQIEAYFSYLAINKHNPAALVGSKELQNIPQNNFCYVRNRLVMKEYFVFSNTDIKMVTMRKSLLARLHNTGTIVLYKHDGNEITISSLRNPDIALKYLSK